MNVVIRQVSLEDLNAVTEIEARCFSKAESAGRVCLEQRIKISPESFFAAEAEGKIIGFINGCLINGTEIYDELFKDPSLHIPGGDYQTIFGVDVAPEYRNKGIAAQLINHMIEVSKSSSCKGIILTCKENLINYYTKFGFVNKGISKSVHGGANWYDMILEFN